MEQIRGEQERTGRAERRKNSHREEAVSPLTHGWVSYGVMLGGLDVGVKAA